MRMDDFIMLGTTVPEESKRYGKKVCSAGYDRELRALVRIYPLGLRAAPRRWTRNSVHVERSVHDGRKESWALAGRHEANQWTMNNAFVNLGKLAPHEVVDLCEEIDEATPDSIAEANDARVSLTLIRPKSLRFTWAKSRPNVADDAMQMELFATHTGRTMDYLPRIEFVDADGGHRLQVREWGCYELIRKNGLDYAFENMEQALQLHADVDDVGLLVGNMNNHRTSWLVISVLHGLTAQPALFGRAAS